MDERLHKLEEAFIRVDSTFQLHTKHEEKAFARLHSDISRLVDKIDTFTEVLANNNESVKDQIYANSEKFFVDKTSFSDYKIQALYEVDDKIKESRKETLKFISMVGSLLFGLITIGGWVATHLGGNG